MCGCENESGRRGWGIRTQVWWETSGLVHGARRPAKAGQGPLVLGPSIWGFFGVPHEQRCGEQVQLGSLV